MKNLLAFFSKNQSNIYKVFLFAISTLLIIYLLPKGGQFKYNFQKGKPWQYENLYAPFSFTIKKDGETLKNEEEAIRNAAIPYFDFNTETPSRAKDRFLELLETSFVDSLYSSEKRVVSTAGINLLNTIYETGVLDGIHAYSDEKLIYLKKGNELEEHRYGQLFQKENLEPLIRSEVANSQIQDTYSLVESIVNRVVVSNVSFNSQFTEEVTTGEIERINPNRGIVDKGSRIIAKGEVVEGNTYQILNSLKAEYQSQVWSESNYNWLVLGYALLVSLVFLMLLLFLKKYRFEIFENNTKVTFIFFNIVLLVFLTNLVVQLDAKYVYVVPLCILPLILKAFFDPRLGLFVHVLTLLLLGFMVPNSFEYLFLQIIAGVVTILTVSELYKRANLFISVGQITFVYIIGYFAFFIIQEGNIRLMEWETYGYFILCGLATLFAHPLIYLYEKIFGLVSDVSLLELSDTNSKLLKELSNKSCSTA